MQFCCWLLLTLVAGVLQAQTGRQRASRRLPPRAPSQPAVVKIRVQEERVTADIRFAPLQQVLGELADWTGVVFEVESQDNPLITIRLDSLPLNDAIERILQQNNTVYYYDETGGGEPGISFVRVFPRSRRDNNPASLVYLGSGQVTKTEADAVDSPEQALVALRNSADVDARQKAVEVLVEARSPEAAAALTEALNDGAPEVRAAAVEGLAGLGLSEALPLVLRALRDPHSEVRQSAVVALSLLGDNSHVRDLTPLLHDRDASVAAAAEMAVRKLLARAPG